MGREIAEVMGPAGIPWLERPERQKEEDIDALIKNLSLKRGMSAVDIGAGSGVLSMKMARYVGKSGKVYAVEIQKEMLRAIRKNAKKNLLQTLSRY